MPRILETLTSPTKRLKITIISIILLILPITSLVMIALIEGNLIAGICVIIVILFALIVVSIAWFRSIRGTMLEEWIRDEYEYKNITERSNSDKETALISFGERLISSGGARNIV